MLDIFTGLDITSNEQKKTITRVHGRWHWRSEEKQPWGRTLPRCLGCRWTPGWDSGRLATWSARWSSSSRRSSSLPPGAAQMAWSRVGGAFGSPGRSVIELPLSLCYPYKYYKVGQQTHMEETDSNREPGILPTTLVTQLASSLLHQGNAHLKERLLVPRIQRRDHKWPTPKNA